MVIGAVLVAAAVAAATCVPPPDFVSFSLGIPTTPFDGLSATRFAASAAGVWRGLFPIPLGVGRWNTNLLDHLPAHEWWQALVAIGIVVLVTRALWTRPFARTLWLVGTLGVFAFSVVVVLPDRSHYAGAFFVLFLVCVWCAVAPPGRAPAGLPELTGGWTGLIRIATVVFVAQVVATVVILPYNSVHPFAPDRTLAQVAAARGMRDRIVSGQDYDSVTMSGYLDVPVYSVARHDWIRYFHNDQREGRRQRAHDRPGAALHVGAARSPTSGGDGPRVGPAPRLGAGLPPHRVDGWHQPLRGRSGRCVGRAVYVRSTTMRG